MEILTIKLSTPGKVKKVRLSGDGESAWVVGDVLRAMNGLTKFLTWLSKKMALGNVLKGKRLFRGF